MSLKKNIREFIAEHPHYSEALESFSRWDGSRRPVVIHSQDQLARRAEFERLFKLIPKAEGPTWTAASVCGVSGQTVRIWRCASAHRFPSWAHIEKLKDFVEIMEKKQ